MCFSDPSQGTVSADYIADNGLATKVAVIYDSSDTYSTGIYQNFTAEADAKGLEIVAAEAFTKTVIQTSQYRFRKQKTAEQTLDRVFDLLSAGFSDPCAGRQSRICSGVVRC